MTAYPYNGRHSAARRAAAVGSTVDANAPPDPPAATCPTRPARAAAAVPDTAEAVAVGCSLGRRDSGASAPPAPPSLEGRRGYPAWDGGSLPASGDRPHRQRARPAAAGGHPAGRRRAAVAVRWGGGGQTRRRRGRPGHPRGGPPSVGAAPERAPARERRPAVPPAPAPWARGANAARRGGPLGARPGAAAEHTGLGRDADRGGDGSFWSRVRVVPVTPITRQLHAVVCVTFAVAPLEGEGHGA